MKGKNDIKPLDVNTKKKWLSRLYLTLDWFKDRVCKNCYSDLPGWIKLPVGVEVEPTKERCIYCKAPKEGNTIAPWFIPDAELERLMEKRVWSQKKLEIEA